MLVPLAFAAFVAATMPVNDYDTCRTWFAAQSGSQLLSNRIVDRTLRFAPSKAPDSLVVSSSGAGWATDTAQCQISYDSAHGVAMVSVSEDASNALVLTTGRESPVLAKSSAVSASTRNGVSLGMSRDQVTAIEGAGTVVQFPDQIALVYDQSDGTRLAFWFVDHAVAGVMVYRHSR